MKIFEIIYSYDKVVIHESFVAVSFVEALEDLDAKMPDVYYDVLGCFESDLPNILRSQAGP